MVFESQLVNESIICRKKVLISVMAPKKRSVAKKQAFTDEDLAKREKVDLLVKDLEVQTEKLIKDKEREIEGVITSINTMYKVCVNVF